MTISASRGSNSDDAAMIRNRRMYITPNGAVTRRTVAAGREVLADRQAGQRTR